MRRRSTRTGIAERLAQAEQLLRRAEPELVPCHDSAERLRRRFGVSRPPAADLIEKIRAFLGDPASSASRGGDGR